MKSLLRKPLAFMLSAVVAVGLASSVGAAVNDPKGQEVYRIVALGDSISVGYEPGMDLSSVAYGYAERLYEQSLFHARSEFANYAIMGLTTPGLVNLLKGSAESKPLTAVDLQDFSMYPDGVDDQANSVAARAPQLAKDLTNANLVVMTIGANDFGPIINAAKDQSVDAARQIIQDSFVKTMNKYTEDLDEMMTILHKLAPNAQIVLADQYNPLRTEISLYGDLAKLADEVADKLDLFKDDLDKKGIPLQIAHVSYKFKGDPFLTHLNPLEMDTHPTQAGYETIAQVFADVVWKKYQKPTPRAKGVPISVVINGVESPNKAVIVKNTTFLAIRDVANAVDAEFIWNQKTKTASFSKNGRKVVLTIGAKTIQVNGAIQPLDTPAYFQQSGKELKTYVPLAVISEGLDFQVVFRKQLLTAFINS